MRILHYLHGLPPVRGGGLVKYALDLAEMQSKSDDVALLLPGPISYAKKRRKCVSIKADGEWKDIPKYRINNPLPVPMGNGILDIKMYTVPCDVAVYMRFLEGYKPDVIHVHTFMGLHKEFLEAVKKLAVPVVYTTHDYFGICPIANLLHNNCICTQQGEWCGECSRFAFSEKRLWLEQTSIYRVYRNSEWLIQMLRKDFLRYLTKSIRSVSPEKSAELEKDNLISGSMAVPTSKEYKELFSYYRDMFELISFYHFNSHVCRQAFESSLGELDGEVIYISNKSVSDKRTLHKSEEKLKIGFLGGDVAFKGLGRLQKIISELYSEGKTQIELQVYGSLEQKEYPFCSYYGAYSEDERDDVFAKMDILAVPSSWLETFGMVVVEALSYGVPVIVTDKVGGKGLIEDCEEKIGIVLPDNDDAWKDCICDLYEHRDKVEKYSQNISRADLELDFMVHVKKMKELYQTASLLL